MTAAKYLLAPSVVASRIDYAARVAALLTAVDEMEQSAAHRGIPSPESIARVFRRKRDLTHFSAEAA